MTRNIFIILALVLGIFVLEYFSSLAPQSSPPRAQTSSTQTGSYISQTDGASQISDAVRAKVTQIMKDADVQRTLTRIDHTDPKYHQDNAIFTNREHILQVQTDRSYYREWTVETPGSRDRGSRRIIVGKR
jgi:ribonuclease T1